MSKYSNTDAFYLSNIFKALSNPNRLKIFMRLLQCCVPGTQCRVEGADKTCISDLGQDLHIVPSTLSHHIKELNRAGLIHTQRRGQHVDCWVDAETINELSCFFEVVDQRSSGLK